MTKDWEPIFSTWTKPPSDTEQTRCDNSVAMIKNAIDAHATLSKMTIEVFAQGSYANNTNVRLNSDVDISIRNMDYLFCKYPEGKTGSDFGNSDSDYTFATFKGQVEIALGNYFGKANKRGNKAFDIRSNSYRVEADAVPCFEHRRYTGSKSSGGDHLYHSGTEFITDDGKRIINWPKQHIENGIQKNKDTSTQFKKVVRILKRLNLEMGENKIEAADKVTSFLIECLCWNTDNPTYNSRTYTEIVRNTIIHLYNSTKEYKKVEEWGEINELKYLFRASQPWKLEDVNDWTVKAWNYIGFK